MTNPSSNKGNTGAHFSGAHFPRGIEYASCMPQLKSKAHTTGLWIEAQMNCHLGIEDEAIVKISCMSLKERPRAGLYRR